MATETETELETFDVLYNKCYGGYGISKAALDLYNKKLLERNPDAIPEEYDWAMSRTDPILLEVFYKMDGKNCKKGEGFNDKCSKVSVAKVAKIYEDCYRINEYDGLETIYIDFCRFQTEEMFKIANDESLSYEERIKKIQNLKVTYHFEK